MFFISVIYSEIKRKVFLVSSRYYPRGAPNSVSKFPRGRTAVVFFLCFLLVFSTASALESAPPEQEKKAVITSLEIKGLEDVKTSEIRRSMITPFPSRRFWRKRPEFNSALFEDDIKRIEQLMHEHGYYDSRVAYSLNFRDNDSKLDIEITVDQGDRVTVKSLNVGISGENTDDLEYKVTRTIPLRNGGPFSQIAYQRSKLLIAEVFSETGYVLADIKSEAIVNLKEKEAEVEFIIDPGDRFRFAKTVIRGNKDIRDNLIRREVEHREGELFSLSKIKKSRANIFETGLLDSVIVNTDYDERNLEVRTTYSVTESKLGTLRFGVGYATEDKMRGQFSWTQKNFVGGGRTLRLASGYSSLTRDIKVELDQPHLIGRNSNLTVLLNARRDQFPSYEGRSIDSSITASRDFSDNLTLFTSLDLIYADIKSQVVRTPLESARDSVLLTVLDAGVEYDRTDSFIDPTRGSRIFFSAQRPIQFASSENVDYLKFFGETSYYKKVFGTVLAKRITVGTISTMGGTTSSDVPIFEKFFSGGGATMRGYMFQQLSPLNSNGDPLGGNSMIVGNAESRFGLFYKFGGVVFLDYGNVYPGSFGFDLNDIRYAAGAGIRYDTAIGPVRADFAYLLNPDDAHKDDRFRVFISIGQAF